MLQARNKETFYHNSHATRPRSEKAEIIIMKCQNLSTSKVTYSVLVFFHFVQPIALEVLTSYYFYAVRVQVYRFI